MLDVIVHLNHHPCPDVANTIPYKNAKGVTGRLHQLADGRADLLIVVYGVR